jgi:hypothetical protein
MSVGVWYAGQFGNNIFQYCCARLFSLKNKLKLVTSFNHPNIIPVTPHEDFPAETKLGQILGDEVEDLLDRDYPPANYSLGGFFQKGSWYHQRRDQILGFLKPTPVEKNTKDIVVHVRLGDYGERDRIHPAWYLDILTKEKFDHLYLVTNERNERYFSHFKQYSPTIVSSTLESDWNFIRSFDRIICANSTYSWWSAFFGDHSRIYTHKRWLPSVPNARLSNGFVNGVEVDGPFIPEMPW